MKYILATSRLLAALMVALTLFGLLTSTTYAKPKPSAGKENATLERAFAEQRRILEQSARRLDKADARAAKVAEWIGKVKAKGKDTAALDTALAAFKEDIAAARSSWSATNATLATHAGFDGAGKVTDAAQARVTVEQARGQLEPIRETLKAAYGDLRAAIVAFRKANRGVDDPQVPAEE